MNGYCLFQALLCLFVTFLDFSATDNFQNFKESSAFCFWTKSISHGRTQHMFLHQTREDNKISLVLYDSIWNKKNSLVDCTTSNIRVVTKTYMSKCWEPGNRLFSETPDARFNISELVEPAGPCLAVGHLAGRRVSVRRSRDLESVDRKVAPTWQNSGETSGLKLKRSKRAWMIPGTLWCGAGNKAFNFSDLGMFVETDKCCREHDHCKDSIASLRFSYGIFNTNLFTLSHCGCDNTFSSCLHRANESMSDLVGYGYFNVLKMRCFEFSQRMQCAERTWWGMCKFHQLTKYALVKDATYYNTTSSPEIEEDAQALTKYHTISNEEITVTADSAMSSSVLPEDTGTASREQFSVSWAQMTSSAAETPVLKGETTDAQHTETTQTKRTDSPWMKWTNSSKMPASDSPKIPTSESPQTQRTDSPLTKWEDSPKIPTSDSLPTKSTDFPITQWRDQWTDSPDTQITGSLPSKTTELLQTQRTNSPQRTNPPQTQWTNSPEMTDAPMTQWTGLPDTPTTASEQTKTTDSPLSHGTDSPHISTTLSPQTQRTDSSQPWSDVPKTKSTGSQTQTSGSSGSWKTHLQPDLHTRQRGKLETCESYRDLDSCHHQIPAMQEKFGLRNNEFATLYHCNCTARLAKEFARRDKVDDVHFFLLDFVSQFCFMLPLNGTECESCSTSSTEAPLIKRWSKNMTRERPLVSAKRKAKRLNSKRSKRKDSSFRLYKKCLRMHSKLQKPTALGGKVQDLRTAASQRQTLQ